MPQNTEVRKHIHNLGSLDTNQRNHLIKAFRSITPKTLLATATTTDQEDMNNLWTFYVEKGRRYHFTGELSITSTDNTQLYIGVATTDSGVISSDFAVPAIWLLGESALETYPEENRYYKSSMGVISVPGAFEGRGFASPAPGAGRMVEGVRFFGTFVPANSGHIQLIVTDDGVDATSVEAGSWVNCFEINLTEGIL